MPGGPQSRSHRERLALAQHIVARLKAVHRHHLLAAGIYGSTARGDDGPFSDLEMFAVLNTADERYAHEWQSHGYKVEVDVRSKALILEDAAVVDDNWSRTHGAYVDVRPLYDPTRFFDELRQTVLSQPDEKFDAALHGVIVGDLLDCLTKVRNASHEGDSAGLVLVVADLLRFGAYLAGLANRRLYSSYRRMLDESLLLRDRPDGYEALCRLVVRGELSEPTTLVRACEAFWAGVERWALARGIALEEVELIPF